MCIMFQRMPASVAGGMWKASLKPLTTIFSTLLLFLGDELRSKCLGKERKLISVYLFPLSSDAFICPAAVTPHFKFKCALHVLFANFEKVPWFDPRQVENRGSQGATARLGVLNLVSLLRLMGLRGFVFYDAIKRWRYFTAPCLWSNIIECVLERGLNVLFA